MSEIQYWIAECLRSAPPDDQKRLAGPTVVVLMTDHVVALARREHRIRDLESQLASRDACIHELTEDLKARDLAIDGHLARIRELEEALQGLTEIEMPSLIGRYTSVHDMAIYTTAFSECRNIVRVCLKGLDTDG